MGGPQGCTEGGGVGDGQTEYRSAKDIGENLGYGGILGGPTR